MTDCDKHKVSYPESEYCSECEEELKLKFIKENDWERIDGYKINVETFPEDYKDLYDYVLVPESVEESCVYYLDESGENCFDEIDDVIDYIEDHSETEDVFETWRKLKGSDKK